MSTVATISVKLDGVAGLHTLHVEEWHPYEPSAYCHDEGWTCVELTTALAYFVSVTGAVYRQPRNVRVRVGEAPLLRAEADRAEAQLTAALEPSR